MEEKKKFTLDDVPGGYAMCTRNDCEVCNHCLRHLAFQKVGKGLWKIDHVGIYLNGNRFIHASTKNGVMISPMQDKYWGHKYQGARRFK